MSPSSAALLEELWADRRTILPGRSEDEVSRAFLGLAQKLNAGVQIANPRAYLGTAALRAGVDDSRRAHNADLALSEDEYVESRPFASPRTALLRTALIQELNALPIEDATAWAATEIQGLDVREAADVLGVHYSTVSRRAERARRHLAKELA